MSEYKQYKDIKKSAYDDLVYSNKLKFNELFASFYDMLSCNDDKMVYVEPLVNVEPQFIELLEKYFNLKKIYQEDLENEKTYFTDTEPKKNQKKQLVFIGCKEKRKREVTK